VGVAVKDAELTNMHFDLSLHRTYVVRILQLLNPENRDRSILLGNL
jgi:hypothetical protein